jgi:ABC-type phosphate transport system auxiliary subunit
MTQSDKDAKLAALRDDAKELQLRYAYLQLQLEAIEDELKTIRVLMRAGEGKFANLQQQPVDPEPAPTP